MYYKQEMVFAYQHQIVYKKTIVLVGKSKTGTQKEVAFERVGLGVLHLPLKQYFCM